jgi:hypothetical protein
VSWRGAGHDRRAKDGDQVVRVEARIALGRKIPFEFALLFRYRRCSCPYRERLRYWRQSRRRCCCCRLRLRSSRFDIIRSVVVPRESERNNHRVLGVLYWSLVISFPFTFRRTHSESLCNRRRGYVVERPIL